MKFKICSICIAVSGTWITLLILRASGMTIDLALISMLMGGSVVGISYTLVKQMPAGREMLWKFASICLGFIAVYTALASYWLASAVALALAGIAFFALRARKEARAASEVKGLEKKLENCCE